MPKEQNMSRDKMENALSAALNYLEGALTALSNNEEKALGDSLWSASAETEYAVFLLSLMIGDKTGIASSTRSARSKPSLEFKATLTSAQELLRDAKVGVEATDFEKGYEQAWRARNLLLKAQGLLEKKRKETKK